MCTDPLVSMRNYLDLMDQFKVVFIFSLLNLVPAGTILKLRNIKALYTSPRWRASAKGG
jgi:hypothetical protein